MTLTKSHIGKLIRHFREKALYTQRELSTHLETTQSKISKWEHGSLNINLLELIDFCEVVGTTPTKFFNKMSKIKYTVKLEVTIK